MTDITPSKHIAIQKTKVDHHLEDIIIVLLIDWLFGCHASGCAGVLHTNNERSHPIMYHASGRNWFAEQVPAHADAKQAPDICMAGNAHTTPTRFDWKAWQNALHDHLHNEIINMWLDLSPWSMVQCSQLNWLNHCISHDVIEKDTSSLGWRFFTNFRKNKEFSRYCTKIFNRHWNKRTMTRLIRTPQILANTKTVDFA